MEYKDPGRYIPIIYLLDSWGSRFGDPSKVPLALKSRPFLLTLLPGRKLGALPPRSSVRLLKLTLLVKNSRQPLPE